MHKEPLDISTGRSYRNFLHPLQILAIELTSAPPRPKYLQDSKICWHISKTFPQYPPKLACQDSQNKQKHTAQYWSWLFCSLPDCHCISCTHFSQVQHLTELLPSPHLHTTLDHFPLSNTGPLSTSLIMTLSPLDSKHFRFQTLFPFNKFLFSFLQVLHY